MSNQLSRPFAAQGRWQVLERAASTQYDMLVVGGGIVGAGIARDAAMRGLSVLLAEQGDLASGTSSKSSKLLHGGLRYLEQFEFKLVWEACHERALLGRLAPHLARPVPFIFPTYQGMSLGPLQLEVALTIYDAMAGRQNIGRHRRLPPREMLKMEPRMRADGLRGGGLYYDSVTDDARLTLETARSAWEHGADILTYARVEELVTENGQVTGATIRDVGPGASSDPLRVQARVVMNASGPWSDEIRRKAGVSGALLRPTKGVHLMLSARKLPLEHAVVLPSPTDHRILFVVPWGDTVIVGTTDTDFEGTADQAHAVPEDVRYILEVFAHYFPWLAVGPDDVLATYAGLRPLVDDRSATESQTSREHRILEDRPRLLTIAGGKLTTYRVMAAQMVDRAAAVLKREGGTPAVGHSLTADQALAPGPAALNGHLSRTYGARGAEVEALAAGPLGQPLYPGSPDPMASAVYAVRHEMAVHLDDVLGRRTHALLGGISLEDAAAVCGVLAADQGWDPARQESEMERFRRSWTGAHGWRESFS